MAIFFEDLQNMKNIRNSENSGRLLFGQDRSGLLPILAPIYYGAGQCLVSSQQSARFQILRDDSYNYYSRDGLNQTVLHVERKLSDFYGLSSARLVNSGMAALLVAVLVNLRPTSRIFVATNVFIDTQLLALNHFGQMGYEVSLFDLNECGRSELKNLRKDDIIIVESVTNPLCMKSDLVHFQGIARRTDCTLIVDNTLPSSASLSIRPGKNVLVVESLTKYHLMNAGTGGAIFAALKHRKAVHEIIKLFGLCMQPDIASAIELLKKRGS